MANKKHLLDYDQLAITRCKLSKVQFPYQKYKSPVTALQQEVKTIEKASASMVIALEMQLNTSDAFDNAAYESL